MKQHFYAAQHMDKDICQKSSSGGAFTAITDKWFSVYGSKAVVYGCAMDEQLNAAHVRAATPKQRDLMRGSKYIGSNMSGIMRQVWEDLTEGKYVAFSGTPCQITGLKAFLGMKGMNDSDKLLTIEVICRGVGSAAYFRDYIADYEKRYKSKAVSCSFRGKMRPGKRQQMVIRFENGKRYICASSRYDEFLSAYGRSYLLRPSCFCCPYASMERHGDITIGDYWADAHNNMDVRSVIIANSQWGHKWFQACEEALKYQALTSDLAKQPQLVKPAEMPSDYEAFWTVYRGKGYIQTQAFLGNTTVSGRIKRAIARIAYCMRIKEILHMIKIGIGKLRRVKS